MSTIYRFCVVCGRCPEPGHRLAITLPGAQRDLACACDHHDPAEPGFREDLCYWLFRRYGAAIGDDASMAALVAVADLIAAQLTSHGPGGEPRRRRHAPVHQLSAQQLTPWATAGAVGPGHSGQAAHRGAGRWAHGAAGRTP